MNLSGQKFGEFELRERIAEGGSGAVYRSVQPPLKREVVVKVLHDQQGSSHNAMLRFEREAQLASKLTHPYATHIYAFGVQDGRPWIAMELVHGSALNFWLIANGPMPLEPFVSFFEGLTDAVADAHQKGIVHRDLKPSNVMVVQFRKKQTPKLLDLGIAKISPELEPPAAWPDSSMAENQEPPQVENAIVTMTDPGARNHLTPRGVGIGSWAYMAPEQWENASEVGPAADIYSLGILAYEALTGRLPFTASDQQGFYRHHLRTKVPPMGGDFSPAFDRFFQRALAKQPRDRFHSAQQMASALKLALRQHLARHSTRVRRLGVALVAALALSIVLGILQYRSNMEARVAQEKILSAQRVMAATARQAELERGRSDLLHGAPEALSHLSAAYDRGDHSAGTTFMLARAIQPRLSERARFTSTFGRMWSAAFSPDGQQVVTSDDRGAQIWDTTSHRLLFALPHGTEVYQAIYSNHGDRLATVTQDAVKIWSPVNGTLVRTLTHKHSDGRPNDYFVGALSADGRFVSAMDSKGAIAHVWYTATGALLAELPNNAAKFPSLAFSPDGLWLATSGGNDVRVFDTKTWRSVLTIPGPQIDSLAFSPESLHLVTGAVTGDVTIWEIPGGARARHLSDVGDPISVVAFSPDGQLVAAVSREGTEQVWQAISGKVQSRFDTHHSSIFSVEFDPSSKLVLAAGFDGAVVIADAMSGLPLSTLDGPKNQVVEAHFSPTSSLVVGASWDGTARVWDASAPYHRWSSPSLSDDCGVIRNRQIDRRFIGVACKNWATRVWDTSRDELIAELPSVTPVTGDFTSAFPAISAAGDRAAIARGNVVEVYELPSRRLLHTITHSAPVNAVDFASSGRDIVSGAIDGSLLVTMDNGAVLALPMASAAIDAVAFLPDGRVAASDAQQHLYVYARNGAILTDLQLPARMMSIKVGLSRLVALPIYSANAASPVLVDFERYRVISRLEGHVGEVYSARWVAGDQILTAGGDGTARLWAGATGQLIQTYEGSSQFLADATMSADGSMVIAGGADGLLRFWDAIGGTLLWTMDAHKSYLVGIHIEGDDIVTRGLDGMLSRWTLPKSEQVIDACSDHGRCAIVPR
jgi:WD40 repeat protein/serine/threonine protein kinase